MMSNLKPSDCDNFYSLDSNNLNKINCSKGNEMGPLATKVGLDVNDNSGGDVTYYGINVPADNLVLKEDGRCLHVYTDKVEALQVMKKYKKARFKAFKSKDDAIYFAVNGWEEFTITSPISTTESSDSGTSLVGEKYSLFKGPKAQDLVRLRKSIEFGDLQMVKMTIWENPRYLVSSGDTPAILQEGSRYNALHVAAKSRSAPMVELILCTVSDVGFLQLLYGEDDLAMCEERSRVLLDLYLNTPDKGLNETPLHFAVKFGGVAAAEVLVSYPQCDRNLPNRFGQIPADIICSRLPTADSIAKAALCRLLSPHFYVPVLRSTDNSVQPSVGEPFSPGLASPLLSGKDPLQPRLEIQAYAGPMGQEQAAIFRKKWKTPPRMSRGGPQTPTRTPGPRECCNTTAVRLQDTEKGLERVGRNLAQEFNVGWKEFWPFLNTFTDLSSQEGLEKLDAYLKKRFLVPTTVPGSTPSSTSQEEPVVSPISDLCLSFKACSLLEQPATKRGVGARQDRHHIARREVKGSEDEGLSNPGLSPFLYVEKSCQVFAKRIHDGLVHACLTSGAEPSPELLRDKVLPEAEHLCSLVTSYLDDVRFVPVDFHRVHSRLGCLVASRLHSGPLETEEVGCLARGLGAFAQLASEACSSDDEDPLANHRAYRVQRQMEAPEKTDGCLEQARCLAYRISEALDCASKLSAGRVASEADCMDAWSQADECCCPWLPRRSKQSVHKRNHNTRFMPSDSNTRTMLYGQGDAEMEAGCEDSVKQVLKPHQAKQGELQSSGETL